MPLIVIVDDRVTNRNIFAKLAATIAPDVEVMTFGEPLEALVWLDDHTPDLLITDYKMPRMDGADFIRCFRDRPECVDVPAIVITVYEERNFRLRALEAGATDFLNSPVDHNEFVTRARNLLKLRAQQQVIRSRADVLARQLEDSERSREKLMRDSTERLAQVIDTVPAMVSATDRDGNCVFMNASHAALSGLEPTEAVGRSVREIFGDERGSRAQALDQLVFTRGRALPSYEEEINDRAGARRVLLTTKSPLRDGGGRVVNVLTTSLDITDRKRAERHLHHMAHHDALTDLPNRALLHDRIRREIARSRRGDRLFALHLIDLDRFKGVNDVLGHEAGDTLLKSVSARLCVTVREMDTVARLGGDEFAILQTGISGPDDAIELAERLGALFREPFVVDGRELNASASIGIAVHPSDGADVDELLKNADIAMYQAKAGGRDGHRLYLADMIVAGPDPISLEVDLSRAMERGEFELHYQPQVDLATGRIVGAEALLRWRRPGSGLVSPGEFLPLAEENGLIVPINEWVLRTACAEARSWTRRGLPPLRIGVNLSPVQFRKIDVEALVARVLADTGLEPQRLDLELTESIVMQDTDRVARCLRGLRQRGVACSIDDFGTGYSSLAYVKSFPVDRLKIDQCFIRNLTSDPNDAAIVRAIISLGHSLGLGILAEGVETADQSRFLRAEGCDEVQGYHYGRPMPAADLVDLVERENRLAETA